MKKELFIHFAFWFAFFALVSILRNFLSFEYWPFWVGGIVGNLLADTDHLVYVFFLSPQELTSQRVTFLLKRKEILRVLSLLSETRKERKNLVFHSFLFQIIFFAFAFFIISSTTSIFVQGIVLALSLHLIVDEVSDYLEMKDLSNWGKILSTDLDATQSVIYISVSFLLVCVLGFLM